LKGYLKLSLVSCPIEPAKYEDAVRELLEWKQEGQKIEIARGARSRQGHRPHGCAPASAEAEREHLVRESSMTPIPTVGFNGLMSVALPAGRQLPGPRLPAGWRLAFSMRSGLPELAEDRVIDLRPERSILWEGLARRAVSRNSPMHAPFGIVVVFLSSTAVAAAQEVKCDQEQSQQEIQKLTDAGAILSIDRFPPYVTVVVDERRWALSNFDTKRAMAQHVDCAAAGPSNNMLRTVIFRSNRDNQVLGEYSRSELKLR
jgi:hypothetical protein